MSGDGKLYIIITDKPGGNGNGEMPPLQEDGTQEKKKQSNVQSYAVHQFYNLVTNQTKRAINFTLDNIGTLTGDYITQRRINNTKEALNVGIRIGTATLAGAKIGGVIGAVVGAVYGIASETFGAISGYYQGLWENQKINYNIDRLRARSGLNVTLDGSRGTMQ